MKKGAPLFLEQCFEIAKIHSAILAAILSFTEIRYKEDDAVVEPLLTRNKS
jgi:hypothetical protein